MDQQTHEVNRGNRPIVFFDGVCNLCNGAVQFILRNEKTGALLFAPIQGAAFTRLVASQASGLPESIVLLADGHIFTESTAALKIAGYLCWYWRVLVLPAWLVPAFLRNIVYRFIARNRYRWFGKKEACYLPTPALKARFLD